MLPSMPLHVHSSSCSSLAWLTRRGVASTTMSLKFTVLQLMYAHAYTKALHTDLYLLFRIDYSHDGTLNILIL